MFAGLLVDPGEIIDAGFEEAHDEIVIVRDIPFASMCEHHLVPFVGRAHVGYLPNERGQVAGLSKLARLVDVLAKRPGLQERITTAVVDTIMERLAARGALVVIEAEHFCMTMRGVRKPGAVTVTSAVRGTFRHDPRSRGEVMALVARPPRGTVGAVAMPRPVPLVRVIEASAGAQGPVRLVVSGLVDPGRLLRPWSSSGASVRACGQRLHAVSTPGALERAAGRALERADAEALVASLHAAVRAWRGPARTLPLPGGRVLALDRRPAVVGVVNVHARLLQ